MAAPAYTEGQAGGQLTVIGRQVALDGTVRGQVVQGERQRDGSAPRAAPSSLTLGRNFGSVNYLPEVRLDPNPTTAMAGGFFTNALDAALDAIPAVTGLALSKVTTGGFGALTVRADTIRQPVFGALDLGVGGQLDLLGARSIGLNGEFRAPGGRISLQTLTASADSASTGEGDIRLSDASLLDVSGLWTNDTSAAATHPAGAPVQLNGGTVTLRAAHGLALNAGAALKASAGAWLGGSGTLKKGTAGTLALVAAGLEPGASTLALEGATLSAYDFAAGGTLTLGAPDLTISPTADGRGFTLAPGFFSQGGFGGFTVNSDGDVRVVAGARLAPILRNWEFAPNYRNASSGPMAPEVVKPVVVDSQLAERKTVKLAFNATRDLFFNGASVVVERGSAIELEPGGTLRLSATRNIEVGASGGQAGQTASLGAPGGGITLAVNGIRGSDSDAARDSAGFLADQAIWLGNDARLSVAGIAQLRPDPSAPLAYTFKGPGSTTPAADRVTGTVLGGGSITLAAQRGYVVAEQGSAMALDGASASLNLPDRAAPALVARPAGTLNVSTPEGFALDGSISARAPTDARLRPTADGGRFNASVGVGGTETANTGGRPYLDDPVTQATPAPRRVSIGSYDGLLATRGARLGQDLTQSLGNGTGFVRASLLADAGFGRVTLAAADSIRFDTSLALIMPLGIELNAPAIAAAPGVRVNLDTAYAQLGDSLAGRQGSRSPDRAAHADTSAAGPTRLTVTAPTIDLVGSWGLQGFSNVLLDAGRAPDGEIRLMSPILGLHSETLAFGGRLELAAGQVYAASGARMAIHGLPAAGPSDTGSTLAVRTGASGPAARAPLTAFGALDLRATQIDQDGVLRQPFGGIALAAERELTLGAGSITSVSGQSLTVPYGQTSNLTTWNLPGGATGTGLPRAKGVSLSGAHISTSDAASVSARGGGVVQAWEFFPGVGGSKDYFETAGLYAVLPDYAGTQAQAVDGGRLPASALGKEIVVTMAGSGLAPGRYTLLPARYALIGGSLPQGAFLLRRAADQGKNVLSKPLLQDDGGGVVTGYFTDAGSINVGAPGERFVVEPPATYLARSEIRRTDISELLQGRAATLGAVSTPLLPRDAGQVQVSVSGADKALWQARLDLRGDGGLAGLLDMSATRLALVADLDKTPANTLGVSADVIGRSGAGSVLLGGLRTASGSSAAAPTWSIDQSATSSVMVDLRVPVPGSSPVAERQIDALQVEELVLVARGSVSMVPGTRIEASRPPTLGARRLASVGDGAMVAASANALDLVRTQVALNAGTVTIGADSVLSGRQVALDATSTLEIDSTATLQARALNLGARRIVLGTGAAPDATASRFTGPLLGAVQTTADLTLRSYQSIDFMGAQNWALRPAATAEQPDPQPGRVATRLVLDAPLVRGLDTLDGAPAYADIAAESILLRNTTGRAADPQLSGRGDLVLQALPPLRYGQTGGLALGPGELTLGFDNAALRSGGDIVLQDQGKTIAQQNISLSAARLSATNGAEQSIAAGAGSLRLATEAGSRTLGERVGQGAAVTLSARTVEQMGVIDLPGGRLEITAQGSNSGSAALTFGAGSHTSVAGFTLGSPQDFEVFARAGTIAASAAQGRIELFGTLDASAARRANGSAGQGDAGRITLGAAGAGGQLVLSQRQGDGSMATGSLLARAGSAAGDLGGRLAVDVGSMPSLDLLAERASAGGMTRELAVRVRTGDVALERDITAQRILLGADGGMLTLGATTLNAASDSGGVVQLAAGGNLRLGDATRIDARAGRAGANGGDVLLTSTNGRVQLAAQARVDAGGDDAQDGRIVLRAQRGGDNSSVLVDALNTSRLVAGEVDIEAVRVYGNVTTIAAGSGSGSTLGQTTVRNDSASFMNGLPGMLDALGVAQGERERVHLRAGVEVRSGADLTVNADWQLAGDRAGGDAGFLSLRAAGNLNLNGSLSDGFSTATSAGVLNDNLRSWSYRLAAGADLGAANPLAVIDLSDAASGSGNLVVAAGKLVRTGAGSIEMAAGRDIGFAAGSGNIAQGLAYAAGRKATDQATVLTSLFAGQSAKPSFTEQGGRVELSAQRDIVSAEATQLVNNWLWRSGIPTGNAYANSSQMAWWTEFSRFRQTLGSFGGGNMHIEAGRDIVNLQAMAPTAAWADNKTRASAALQVRNGGDLSVTAGGDLLGGQFLVGRGSGHLRAEGSVAERVGNTRSASTLLAQMDGAWDVSARESATVGAAFNPTSTPVSSSDNRATLSSYFYNWGDAAALEINAGSGSVNLYSDLTEGARILEYGLSTTGLQSPTSLFQVLPGSLRITAAGGDVNLFRSGSGGAMLFPSAQGELKVWSGGNLTQRNTLAMADSDPASWPDYANPLTRQASGALAAVGTNGLIQGTLSRTLAGTSLHKDDSQPAQIRVQDSLTAFAGLLVVPKPARIEAGQDILGLAFSGQNLHATDTTTVMAGRNLLAGLLGDITLAGPGTLEVAAGRQVDLEGSQGISTTGNTRNARLPAQGASVKLSAATSGVLHTAALQASYLQDAGGSARAPQYRDMLLSHVRAVLASPGLTYEQAWAQFQTFPAEAQAAFGRQVLAAEFGAVYLAGPAPTAARMTVALRDAFEARKAELLKAGAQALAANRSMVLPGRDVLTGSAIASYLSELGALSFDSFNLDSTVAARVASLTKVQQGWRDTVAASLGGTAAGFANLATQNPQAPAVLAYQAALQDFSGRHFQAYRDAAMTTEIASAGAAASLFGRKSLPMRLALFDQGFQAAELAGAASMVAQAIWQGAAPLFAYTGSLDMTQSSVVTERGGDIRLVNAGGAINVGLKENTLGGANAAKGVITLGGGDVFGLARDDFQVNTQRVFVVGAGNMNIWSSGGDIDSGRGANTAVAAPPLAARRSVDGVVFELPATTTGSGLGILEDASGRRSGTIGLYPAFGEILALDAFIRAPSVIVGSSVKGADNLQSAKVGGAAAPVSAPALAVAPPSSSSTSDNRSTESQSGRQSQQEARQRNSLLTVDLLGLGPAPADEECSEQDAAEGKCIWPKGQ